MQPIETMTFTTRQRHSNAGSAIKECIKILQMANIQVSAGYIEDGPLLELIDLQVVTLQGAVEYITNYANITTGATMTYRYECEIDIAGRVHFGKADKINQWRADHQVRVKLPCPYCLSAGCFNCDDLGEVWRLA